MFAFWPKFLLRGHQMFSFDFQKPRLCFPDVFNIHAAKTQVAHSATTVKMTNGRERVREREREREREMRRREKIPERS